ncbi:MAG: hypothetical protein ACLFTE_05555 [Salinivenus sp.]
MGSVEVLVPLGFFALVGLVIWLLTDTILRWKAMNTRASEGVAEAVLNRRWTEPSTRAALKWGLVILSLGAALMLVDLLSIPFDSPLAYALLLLASGTALLGYYLVERDADDERPPHPAEQTRSSREPRPETEMQDEW